MNEFINGDICLNEQVEIKTIVDKIREELPLCMNDECWEKLNYIIYFKNDGIVTPEWRNFTAFVSDNSERTFDNDVFDKIIRDTEKGNKSELTIDENICSKIKVDIKLIKNEYIKNIVDSIRNLLIKWDDGIKSKNKKLGMNLDEWEKLYKELKNKFSIFIDSLWEEILDYIFIKYPLENKDITLIYDELCYEFEI